MFGVVDWIQRRGEMLLQLQGLRGVTSETLLDDSLGERFCAVQADARRPHSISGLIVAGAVQNVHRVRQQMGDRFD